MKFKHITIKDKKYLPIVKLSLGLGSTSLIAACGDVEGMDEFLITFNSQEIASSIPPARSVPPIYSPLAPVAAPYADSYLLDPAASPPEVKEVTHDEVTTGIYGRTLASVVTNILWQKPTIKTTNLPTENVLNSGYYGFAPPSHNWYKRDKDSYDLFVTMVSAQGQNNNVNAGKIVIYWDALKFANDPSLTNSKIEIEGGNTNDLLALYNVVTLNQNDEYEVIFKAPNADHSGLSDAGAIYILWDISQFKGKKDQSVILNKAYLSNPVNSSGLNSLAIFGSSQGEKLGAETPLFLEAGGQKNYDMVIASPNADNVFSGNNAIIDAGAIYILWDIIDYYGAKGAGKTKSINFNISTDASSGLLTIYGKAASSNLGNSDNNILYGIDTNGNKALINIDNDVAGTKDIAFQDKDYTYILFGNKISEIDGAGKVISKTIDLGAIETVLGDSAAGFFNYTFVANGLGAAAASNTDADRVGYRFASGTGSDGGLDYTTLADVNNAYKGVSKLSDADGDVDLGVWDIA